MIAKLIDEYSEQKECDYKGEHYSVRDNGAVYRHKPTNKHRNRPLDNSWTFGRKDKQYGYMMISSARVHIIVAIAFYGEYDTSKYVVDHIDTNRCNNRSENLRLVTRFENALSNPITRKRIEYICGGDINIFIENPSCLKDLKGPNQDLAWMGTVTKEEAKNTYNRVMKWANEPHSNNQSSAHIDTWIYSPIYSISESDISNDIIKHQQQNSLKRVNYTSSTYNVKQSNWKTPTEFPLCPNESEDMSLTSYYANLNIGAVISSNKYNTIIIDEYKLHNNTIFVKGHAKTPSPKNFFFIKITFENSCFVHYGKAFFDERGAQREMITNCGEEWNGGDVFDDFC